MSRGGWQANDPMVFPLYEKAQELGIRNHFFHKCPAVEPLSLGKFDVRDVDEPAWLYPELNFIIDHCGAPRVDDFCWIAARCPNVPMCTPAWRSCSRSSTTGPGGLPR